MTDSQIIALFWERKEDAIRETDAVYGRKLYAISDKILRSSQDAEESVSDTYMRAWETIPPQRPNYFFAYLAKICRNLSLGRLQWNSAAKRCAEVVSLTDEMQQCIPDRSHERKLEGEEIGRVLNSFLDSISLESRLIFMRRYWYTDSIQEIAARYNISQSKVKTQLHRTRNRLQVFLESEGIYV
jgi:RNA polymerase sigma-70 factor (ECF subfamily)